MVRDVLLVFSVRSCLLTRGEPDGASDLLSKSAVILPWICVGQ